MEQRVELCFRPLRAAWFTHHLPGLVEFAQFDPACPRQQDGPRAFFGPGEGRAIIDSGASMTTINNAAARAAGVTPLATATGETVTSIQSPTGATTPARLGLLPSLNFADAHISRLPVLVGDFHTFDEWGLSDTPAGLLGLDVLSLFETVSIDLRRRELRVTA